MFRNTLFLGLCLLASSAGTSFAMDDRSICGAAPPKSATIAACSRIIAAPSTSDHDRALAYTFRANAARTRGDNAAAIADYDEALKLLPNFPQALAGRGMAKRASGDTTGGDADLAAAKAINPGAVP